MEKRKLKNLKKKTVNNTQIIYDTFFPDGFMDVEFVLMYLKIKRELIFYKVFKKINGRDFNRTNKRGKVK